MGFAAGVNFYSYVQNNPVNANDPYGLYSWNEFKSDAYKVAKDAYKGVDAGIQLISGGSQMLVGSTVGNLVGKKLGTLPGLLSFSSTRHYKMWEVSLVFEARRNTAQR